MSLEPPASIMAQCFLQDCSVLQGSNDDCYQKRSKSFLKMSPKGSRKGQRCSIIRNAWLNIVVGMFEVVSHFRSKQINKHVHSTASIFSGDFNHRKGKPTVLVQHPPPPKINRPVNSVKNVIITFERKIRLFLTYYSFTTDKSTLCLLVKFSFWRLEAITKSEAARVRVCFSSCETSLIELWDLKDVKYGEDTVCSSPFYQLYVSRLK